MTTSVLLADPTHYDVVYTINPHMLPGQVDRALARRQWRDLADTLERLGLAVEVLPSAAGLPDLVFMANTALPLGDGRVVTSRMASQQRRGEVPIVAAWHRSRGARLLSPPAGVRFEAHGDVLRRPGSDGYFAGVGPRTDSVALDWLEGVSRRPLLRLNLVDPRFYHLDTALAPLDATTALYVEEAFDAAALSSLKAEFSRLLRVPMSEALRFAANGWCPDGHHYVVQADNPVTRAWVEAAGFTVVEVETSEFRKSGGSVFCLVGALD